jgi:hypothetical protein
MPVAPVTRSWRRFIAGRDFPVGYEVIFVIAMLDRIPCRELETRVRPG